MRMPLLLPILLLSACGDAPAPPSTPPAAGRPETRAVEAAGAAGYDGQALRRSLDKTLDARDQQQRDLDAARQAADQDAGK